MKLRENKWIYLILLSLIWGTSFILIKKALIGLTPLQIGTFRILITAIFLVLIGFQSLRSIKKHHWKWVLYSALLGTFFPAFLFAFAIKGIDSSVAAILNSTTSFNALWIGTVFFGFVFNPKQIVGVLTGLIGAIILIYQSTDFSNDQNYWYALFPIISSIGYAFNANIIKKHLQDLEPLAITTGNFVLIIIPTVLVLAFSGFFSSFSLTPQTQYSLFYITILAIMGTGLAKIMFNKLIQISSPIFSTSVTYLIPVVALIWGVLDGEKLNGYQLFGGIVILIGVWLVNKVK